MSWCDTPRVFWNLLTPYTFPQAIPATDVPRLIAIPTLSIAKAVDFEQVLVPVNPDEPERKAAILQYTGKRRLFQFHGAISVRYEGQNTVIQHTNLARGKNGQLPSEILLPIRGIAKLTPGSIDSRAANGLFTLNCGDTIGIVGTQTEATEPDSLTLENFMFVLVAIE